MLDKLFGLSKAGTSVKTEVMAGIATFLTMAYITVVNPAILSTEGLEWLLALFLQQRSLPQLLVH